MSAWFTVYNPRHLHHVTPADIAAYLTGATVDWYALAEAFGIEDEAAVDKAVAGLRVGPAHGKLGEWVEVRYRPAKGRPLDVYRWADPERVRTEVTEAQDEHLAGRSGRGSSAVRKALAGVVEVAAVELGLAHLEDMGLVIAGQVAEYLAGVGGGVLRDTDDQWWAVRRGVPKLLLGRA
jgi:hypothetical protein